MIVVDPVELGDVAFSRASPKWVYDRTGTLVEVPPNTLGVTYDPSDLSKAPYALIEPEATNLFKYSSDFTSSAWNKSLGLSVSIDSTDGLGPYMPASVITSAGGTPILTQSFTANSTEVTIDVYTKKGTRSNAVFFLRNSTTGVNFTVGTFNYAAGTITGSGWAATAVRDGWHKLSFTLSSGFSVGNVLTAYLGSTGGEAIPVGETWLLCGAQVGPVKSSYIPTAGAPVTRAADVVGTTAGMLYSNVPITEPAYDVTATYAKDAAVHDPVTKIVYWSMVDANKGNPLSDPSKWNKRGATNRWAAFDDRNNTQSTSAEELLFVLSPRAIAQGLFLGNVDGSEVRVSMAVPNFGVAYSETRSLVMSTSNSSFFRWGFNRIRRRTSFLSLKLPNFYNGLVTIAIRRPGGVAKCGMCMIGPTAEPGPTLVGLSTEIKDYSTTLFNVDGSSSTIERGYRKLMSLDVVIDTESIEQAEDQMIAWRQKTAVWIGAAGRPDSIICGRYSSFKKVIESYPRSKMALQIEGVLS